ncbi:tyrosine-type recombinase/integrase [Marinococcus halophilus]|uniref:tyrosine-type recombinase/integrase n=1 Tax=Marinococcus halophilus TaxID=1371 RepID=UPI0009A67D4F|nr:tyrosine-type recombinase/integrase [Marinococcus halophilus]
MTTQGLVNVQPLRTQEEIKDMINALRRGNKATRKRKDLAERDVLLFLTGINTGLRAGDLVRLKVADVRTDTCYLQEQKTGKKREIQLASIRPELDPFLEGKPDEAYLFASQKGTHLSTTQVYRILEAAADWLGRSDIGTHTMRKTFGYHLYKQTKDVALLQEIFNHASPTITKRYIGIRREEINRSLEQFRLG